MVKNQESNIEIFSNFNCPKTKVCIINCFIKFKYNTFKSCFSLYLIVCYTMICKNKTIISVLLMTYKGTKPAKIMDSILKPTIGIDIQCGISLFIKSVYLSQSKPLKRQLLNQVVILHLLVSFNLHHSII